MSYFDDQFDAWMDNDCQGTIEDTDLSDVPDSYQSKPEAKPTRRSRKRNESSRADNNPR